jgi:hypothetical protein
MDNPYSAGYSKILRGSDECKFESGVVGGDVAA